ncbi:hypothetical protein [Sphingobium sp. CCH11-B1]|uniref:hypothetical protein n=1 Tax=Sphingobium sp. CCH11-B1 TaxID=1768781 RepID=UPI0018D23E09|nr:hypothetical protein [Sphingobium sp. CCH11-B1]
MAAKSDAFKDGFDHLSIGGHICGCSGADRHGYRFTVSTRIAQQEPTNDLLERPEQFR